MIHYVKGILEEAGKDYIIVDNSGVGIKVFTSSSTLNRAPGAGQTVKLYTYFCVREDSLSLYGFLTREELDMFELLISVSGIGPKAGLAVLSVLSPSKLALSIIGGDSKALTSIPGIGSKTAGRIILELKDKIDKDGFMDMDMDEGLPVEHEHNSEQEAVNALIALGYTGAEAVSAIRNVNIKSNDTETIIKAALKNLMR